MRRAVPFANYTAAPWLQELARHPFDLRKLTPERVARFTASAAGYRFLYATERVDEQVMEALVSLAEEARALEQMVAMQAGELVNSSEERPALHTALRDHFENPSTSPDAKKAAALAREELDKLKVFSEDLDREGRFTDLLMIAIGGSELGPEAHYEALASYRKGGRHAHFLSNIDPDAATTLLEELDLSKTLVVVVSKSGTTLETIANEAAIRAQFIKKGLDPLHHFIAVTAVGSPMDDPSRYFTVFSIWDWVGGRFSTSSMVGGIVIAFACGFDCFWELLKGASAMDKAALSISLEENLPLLAALIGIWNHNFLGYPTVAIIPYAQLLHRYTAHLQQVDMESNGKRVGKKGGSLSFETGPIIWGEPGTNAQHSFFQLLHQGTAVVPLEFIGYRHSQWGRDFSFEGSLSQEKLIANLLAQVIALAVGESSENPNQHFPGNRPSHLLLADQLTPYTLGALLAFYEHKVAFQGFIWQINSFDQEGVQLGKRLASRLLAKEEPFPIGEAFFEQLDAL